MRSRLTTLLLLLVLALQGTTFASAYASESGMAGMQHHCDAKAAHHHAASSDTCPCCPDAAMSASGCAVACVVALSSMSTELNFRTDARDERVPAVTSAVDSLYSAPPIPPPIF